MIRTLSFSRRVKGAWQAILYIHYRKGTNSGLGTVEHMYYAYGLQISLTRNHFETDCEFALLSPLVAAVVVKPWYVLVYIFLTVS